MHPKHMIFKTLIQISLNQSIPNLFRISEYFEKSTLDFSRFNCILGSKWLFLFVSVFPLA